MASTLLYSTLCLIKLTGAYMKKVVFLLGLGASFFSWGEEQDPALFFIGGKVGYQWAQDKNYNHTTPNNSIFGAYGGIQISPNWSWDLGYQYHNTLKANATSVNVDTWLIDSGVRYDWFLRNDLSFYTKVGAAYWELDKERKYNAQLLNSKGVSPLGEVGFSYSIKPNFNLSLGYQYIDSIGDSITGKYDSHSLVLHGRYVFNDKPNETFETAAPQPQESPLDKTYKGKETITKQQSLTFSSDDSIGLFSVDSEKVHPLVKEKLKELAILLRKYSQSRVIITGHTDATGSKSYNQTLSERRAESVAQELIKLGVNKSQITTQGQGEMAPIGDNTTFEGRAKNRRVELTVPSFSFVD